ncbi:MAG: NAD-dependent deacetylase [Anaerolineae bacterium]
MTKVDAQIEQAISLLKRSRHVVALTGAGISTPSGIPDFRSPGSGVWNHVDPMEVASIAAFRRRPQSFYDWMRPLTKTIWEAQPNAAHMALAEMEANGPLQCVITQNIDMLHTRAGSKVVHEVHGHMREATCLQCYAVYPTETALAAYLDTGAVPHCDACGGVLKPNVILFGELLPVSVINEARRQSLTCDLMLVAGSSLEVSPAGDLPRLAKQAGAHLVIVNFQETHLDYLADVVIHADVAEVLPKLAVAFTGGDA